MNNAIYWKHAGDPNVQTGLRPSELKCKNQMKGSEKADGNLGVW